MAANATSRRIPPRGLARMKSGDRCPTCFGNRIRAVQRKIRERKLPRCYPNYAHQFFAERESAGMERDDAPALPGYAGEKPENIRPGDSIVCRKGRASVFR